MDLAGLSLTGDKAVTYNTEGTDGSTYSLDVTLDGVTKSISLEAADITDADTLKTALNDKLAEAFGTGRVTADVDSDGKLNFAAKNSTLTVSSDDSLLGLDKKLSSYISTSDTLGDLMGTDSFQAKGVFENTGKVTAGTGDDKGKYFDDNGDLVDENGMRINADGTPVYESRDLTINGVKVGSFSRDDSLDKVMKAINSSDAGVSVSYSQLTNEFSFAAKDTGSGSKIEFGDDLASMFETRASNFIDLFGEDAQTNPLYLDYNGMHINVGNSLGNDYSFEELVTRNFQGFPDSATISVAGADGETQSVTFGELKEFISGKKLSAAQSPNYTAGTDAVVSVNVNGRNMDLTRSSNTFDLDGMSVTLKGTFNEDEEIAEGRGAASDSAVSFTTKADADTIVSGIQSFVDGFNALVKQIHDAYTTQPLTDSSGNKYDPLTDDDKSDMSESAVKSYEEKAKTGLLFNDSDLSNAYRNLVSAISTGTNGQLLRAVGIETEYDSSSHVTTLSIDEDTLRAALDATRRRSKKPFTVSAPAATTPRA